MKTRDDCEQTTKKNYFTDATSVVSFFEYFLHHSNYRATDSVANGLNYDAPHRVGTRIQSLGTFE